MQRIKDTLGNMADVITKVTRDGKEQVIVKKSYKNIPPKPEQPEMKEGIDPETERTRESIASKCITDWSAFADHSLLTKRRRDFFNDTRK
jgi:hypothetical protein